MALIDLKRVTDLFIEGTEIVFDDNPEDPVLLWMSKLNAFETEECRRDGASARSRYVLALEDPESPDGLVFEARLREMDQAEVLDQVMALKRPELLQEAMVEVQSDPEWEERREMITRTTDVEKLDEEERRVIDRVTAEYTEHVSELAERKVTQARVDLSRDRELEKEYRKRWRDSRATDRFTTAYTRSQIGYGLRLCEAKRAIDGTVWDHSSCQHKRALSSPDEVEVLPAYVIERATQALGELAMARNDARFSGGRPSSSGSSTQPAVEEGSTASTPEATSPAPTTT